MRATLALTTERGRFVLFGTVGLSGFIPNLATLALLTGVFQMNYVCATILATQVAVAWNFVLLDNLVYRGVRSGSVYRRTAEFAALNNADLLLRIPLLALLVEIVHLGYLIATVVTLVAMFVIRFLVTDLLIYRLRRRGSAGPVEDAMVVPAGSAELATEGA